MKILCCPVLDLDDIPVYPYCRMKITIKQQKERNNMSEFNTCRREGRITWGDDFNSLAEVVGLFGIENPRVLGDTSFPVPGKENMLCCFVSEKCGGGWEYKRELGPQCDARGWNETLRYAETNFSIEKQTELIKSEFKAPKTRLVFWRETREGRNWYKFAGVFRLNRVQTENDQFYGDSWCWYDRVDTVAECPKADWRVSSIDEKAMDTMRGELAKCELLDEVECVDKEGKHIEGKERIWPGTILRVVESVRGVHLCCEAQGDDRRFVIPKRDLELGYFHWYWTGGVDETRIVKNAAEEKRCGRFAARSEREKLLARIERKMVDYKKVLSQPGTLAHKRLVRALLRENDWSAWAVAYGEDDPGTVEFDRIPEGFLEAHAIGGSVGYHGLGHFALFDSEGNYVKLVD